MHNPDMASAHSNRRKSRKGQGGQLGKARGQAPGPLLWFTGHVGHASIPVRLSTADISHELIGNVGVTLQHPHCGYEILIDAASPRDVQDYTVFHELIVHGVLWPLKLHRRNEEALAQAISPGAMIAFKSLGFNWPRRPKGARALEAFAQRTNEKERKK